MAKNHIMKLPTDVISKNFVRLEHLELLDCCKLVRREWQELLRNPEFILTHYVKSSSKPSSFILQHIDSLTGEHTVANHNHVMENVNHTTPNVLSETEVVGIVKRVVYFVPLQLGNYF